METKRKTDSKFGGLRHYRGMSFLWVGPFGLAFGEKPSRKTADVVTGETNAPRTSSDRRLWASPGASRSPRPSEDLSHSNWGDPLGNLGNLWECKKCFMLVLEIQTTKCLASTL